LDDDNQDSGQFVLQLKQNPL